MTAALILIAILTLGSAAAAMLRRNLIHSALLLIASWAGIAGFYLWAGAEFVAFAQVLVYVGAISMVVLFAVLLTRQNQVADLLVKPASRHRATVGLAAAACVLGVLAGAIMTSPLSPATNSAPGTSVKLIGLELMRQHGATLLIIGVVLTVALLGATVLAATETKPNEEDNS